MDQDCVKVKDWHWGTADMRGDWEGERGDCEGEMGDWGGGGRLGLLLVSKV